VHKERYGCEFGVWRGHVMVRGKALDRMGYENNTIFVQHDVMRLSFTQTGSTSKEY
jgi:hypothetical protein